MKRWPMLLMAGLAGVAMAAGGGDSPPPEAAAAPAAPAPATAAAPDAGDAAPSFTLPGSDGKEHSLASLAGDKVVVLAWFPKAFTGG